MAVVCDWAQNAGVVWLKYYIGAGGSATTTVVAAAVAAAAAGASAAGSSRPVAAADRILKMLDMILMGRCDGGCSSRPRVGCGSAVLKDQRRVISLWLA